MTGMLLNIAYAFGLVLISPMWLYRMVRHGRYRSGWGERFGRAPVRYGLQPVIWIHGVSVGEVNAARSLVKELHSQLPDYRVAVSTTTDTGIVAARKLFAPDHEVFHWPLDFTFSVRRALNRLRPALVVLMEGEVWPNFLTACNRRGIPVVIVNGRMSPRGMRWRKLGALAGRVFNRLAVAGVQDDGYAAMYRGIGMDAARVQVTGMLKYDTAEVGGRLAGVEDLARAMGIAPDDRLVVAGGTGPGEEKIVLEAFGELRARHPAARLAIIPRKPERFDEVARLIESMGFGLVRRSQRPDTKEEEEAEKKQQDEGKMPGAMPLRVFAEGHVRPEKKQQDMGETPMPHTGKMPVLQQPVLQQPVLLGDTMGELRKFYALASCVFVGRSLVPMGGSDMIESAALGRPTAFGPHTFNFPQAEQLAAHGCARVADGKVLLEQLDRWLGDAQAAAAAGGAAQDYVRSQQGATRRNVEMICRVLGRVPAVRPGGIATRVIPD